MILSSRENITSNVLQLHEVWEKVRLNFRLKTEISRYKTNFKLSLKPKSRVTAVSRSVFY